MRTEANIFRQLQIAQSVDGGWLELRRDRKEVVCLAHATERDRMAELHIALSGAPDCPFGEFFIEQMAAWQRVDDGHVLRLHESGDDDGALFYVSEFADGERLGEFVNRCRPLPDWLVLHLGRQERVGQLQRSVPALRPAKGPLGQDRGDRRDLEEDHGRRHGDPRGKRH